MKQASVSSADHCGGQAAGHPCAELAEPEASWAVPRLFGITQRVPVAVVVALTGQHFGFVMLAFFSVRFCSGDDPRSSLCWRYFFCDRSNVLCCDASFAIGEAFFAGDASFATGEASFAGDASFVTGEASFAGGATFTTGGCRCSSTLTVRAITGGGW